MQESDRQQGKRQAPPRLPKRPLRPQRPRADKPDFPPDAETDLPRRVKKELRQATRANGEPDELMLAVSLAAEHLEDEEPELAVPYLRWAKEVAPRSVTVRETLGIAHYKLGDFKAALSELRAYRRFSASCDQDHLIADCLRGTGQSPTAVAEALGEMLASDDVHAERRVEALLVWSGALLDEGDPDAAKAVLRRADRQMLDEAGDEAKERFQYVVGEIAAAKGDVEAARTAWEPLAAIDEDPYDLQARLAALD